MSWRGFAGADRVGRLCGVGGLDVFFRFVDVSPSCQQVAGSKDGYLSIKLQMGLSENSLPSIETIYVYIDGHLGGIPKFQTKVHDCSRQLGLHVGSICEKRGAIVLELERRFIRYILTFADSILQILNTGAMMTSRDFNIPPIIQPII